MFGRKRLDELERKVRLLEDEKRCLWAMFRELQNGNLIINTFEYGRMPLKEVIKKLAKFAKKEEEAEKRRMLEKMEENFGDMRMRLTLEANVKPEGAQHYTDLFKREVQEAQEREKAEALRKLEAETWKRGDKDETR